MREQEKEEVEKLETFFGAIYESLNPVTVIPVIPVIPDSPPLPNRASASALPALSPTAPLSSHRFQYPNNLFSPPPKHMSPEVDTFSSASGTVTTVVGWGILEGEAGVGGAGAGDGGETGGVRGGGTLEFCLIQDNG